MAQADEDTDCTDPKTWAGGGCWFPFSKFEDLYFNGDASRMAGIWSVERTAQIDAGADPTDEELHQWRIEEARHYVRGTDYCETYSLMSVETSDGRRGVVLITDQMWHGFEGDPGTMTAIDAFETVSDAMEHLSKLGVIG